MEIENKAECIQKLKFEIRTVLIIFKCEYFGRFQHLWSHVMGSETKRT